MLGDHHGAITDENGRYQLLNVTTGSYILKVHNFIGSSKKMCGVLGSSEGVRCSSEGVWCAV